MAAPKELGEHPDDGRDLRMARTEMKAVGSGAQVREVVTDRRISQRQDGAGIEGTRIAGISVGNGSRSAQLEEDGHSLSAQRDALLPRLVFGGGGS